MRSVLKVLSPADASTVLSKLMNCLYLVAFIVVAVLAYLRGEPIPVALPMTQTVTVAPAAPVVQEPVVLPADVQVAKDVEVVDTATRE